jgi:5-hydroxyisourate hydrolase-like protein (transthyretin family)
MKIKDSEMAGWMGRLLLVVCLLVSSATTALAFNVSGTVSNPTGKSGRIYLTVQNSMYGGGTPIAGVSIPSAGAYTIRGLTDSGSYQVSAFMDTQDNGVRHANDPIGTSAVFTDTASSGVNFSLALPAPAFTLQPPKEANVIYGDTTATIFYKGASDNNGNPIATTYNIYWSTNPNPGPANTVGGGSVTGLPSGSKDFYVKYGLSNPTSQYNFAITAVLDGSESAPFNANPASPTTGVNVSGTVTTSGVTLPVNPSHLLMILINDGAGQFITSWVLNPTNSQAFSFSGVPPGTYNLYTIIDLNNNGLIDLGDISDTDIGVSVTVGTSDVTGVAVNLAAANARTYVQTRHYSGGNYSLTLGAATMVKRPVNVAVSGPQIPTMDLGLSSNDNGKFETQKNVPSRPNFPATPDTYSFVIEYSSGSGTSPPAPITGIVDYFATPTAPLGVISYPAPDPLQFIWAPPTPGPAYPYTYSFWISVPNGWFNNDPYWNMPSSTTSVNIPGSALNPQQGVNYSWGIALKDSYGNSSESDVNFSAGGSGSISGMVTSDGSHGISNTFVVLLDSFGKPVAGVPAVQTDSGNGGYYIGNVPTGSYRVYFSAGPGFQSEYFDNQPSFNTAQLLTVNSGDNISAINAILAPAPNTGTIAGHVANASNGQPVLNAMVELLNAGNSSLVTQVYTTSSGDFQISAINPGSYKLRISANGYRTIAPVTVYLVQSGVTTFVSISLPNTVTYTSRVVDSASASIAGAQIDMIVGGNTTTNVASTDGNGYFTITVPFSTSFYLRISKATYVTTYTSSMSYNQDSNTSDRPYSLLSSTDYDGMFTPTSPNSVAKIAGTGSISGRVASAANPLMTLPGATVTASDGTTTYPVCFNDGNVNCSLSSTKANGRFYVLNVPDGKQVTVSVTAKSGPTAYITCPNTNCPSKVFQVVADSASMGRIGMVTTATSYTMISKLVDFTTSVPIANNTVTLYKDSDNSSIGQVNTDSNGLFTAADLLAGTNYYLRLSQGSPYLESYSANTSSPGYNVDRSGRPYNTFSSSPNQITTWGFSTLNAVVTGTIKDSLTGQPIAGATISTTAGLIKYDDGSGNPSSSATSTSAANGRFYVYNIPANSSDSYTTVTITVQTAPGYNTSSSGGASKTYHVKNGTLSQGGFTFNLTSPPTMVNLNGSVSDLFGLPLSGVRVAAYFLSPWSIIKNPELSDSTGKFTLNLPSGIPFALEFISFGKRTAYSQDIQVSQPTTLGNYPLMTNNDYSLLGWPLTAGRTFIRGLALDNLLRPLDGVVVTPNPGTYTVNYVNDADNKTLMTGGATFTNGLFVLKDAAPADQITLTAAKNGYSFFPVSFSHMVADTDSMGGAVDSTPAPGFLSANPSFLNYGSVTVGGGPFSQSVNLVNSGPGSISVNSFNLSGNTGDFTIVPGGSCPTLPGTLPPGNCTVQANFSPTATGTRTATLNISSNASSGSNYTISLSGTGQATVPNAPFINSVTPWDGQATVYFTPSAFDGGSPVQYYTVTATTPGPYFPFVQSGSGSPITVTGMGNGTTYTFTVTATNGSVPPLGTSSSSNAVDAMPYYAPIRIGSTGYGDLASAVTAAINGGIIIAQQNSSPLTLTTPWTISKSISLYGGYSTDYSSINGNTTIPGRLNIRGTGVKVNFKYIKVKP